MIRPRFGTLRGLVRLALSYPQLFLGLGAGRPVDPATVRRLVFVCQGNICRSAFAEAAAGGARGGPPPAPPGPLCWRSPHATSDSTIPFRNILIS